MSTIQIPYEEYQEMKNELIILRQQDLLGRMNELIDLMFLNKYGLYMADFTDDLTQYSISQIEEWKSSGDIWNEI